jgi:hypothetical protein
MLDERARFGVLALLAVLSLVACGGEAPSTPEGAVPEATVESTETPALEDLQARVVEVVNEVDAQPLPETEWEDAVVDMSIHRGGKVWAQEASTARVDVEDGLVRVAPNTIFTLDRPESDTLQLSLDEGQVWIDIEGLAPGEVFEVQTPAAVASVRGTRFGVRVSADGTTVVSTRVGTVTVEAATAAVTLTPGLQTTVVQGDAPEEPEPISPQEQVRWGMAAGSELDVALPAVGDSVWFTHTNTLYSGQCSHDGRYLGFRYWDDVAEKSGYAFHDLVAGTPFSVSMPPGVAAFAFNPVTDSVVYNVDFEQICVGDVAGPDYSCFGQDLGPVVGDVLWSPDGQWLLFFAFGQGGSGLNLFKARPDGSDVTQLTFAEEALKGGVAWSPDGSHIAYLSAPEGYTGPADLAVMTAEGTDAQTLLSGVVYPHTGIAWSPDGSLLAVSGYAAGDEYPESRGLWLARPDGSEAWMVPGAEEWRTYDPVWSPTSSGWPLFFTSYGSGHGQAGIFWYTPDHERTPAGFAYADWGPVWCRGETQSVAFGFGASHDGEHSLAVHSFAVEPAFYGPLAEAAP